MRFKVNEVYHSIQGEGARIGRPCLFIRLTGCPLRCVYCDTEYAFFDGTMQELDDLLTEVRQRLGGLAYRRCWISAMRWPWRPRAATTWPRCPAR